MNDTQVTEENAPAQDTAELQTNEADLQVNIEAPEATQDGQEQETLETGIEAEDTAEQKLYAGKYKTPEDMEKAYKELETKFHGTSQEKAQLARQIEGTFAQQEVDSNQYDLGLEPDPVVQKLERLERNDAVSRFIFSHPDVDGEAVTKVLTSDPIIQQIQGYDARLEYAYLKSKSMTSSKAIEQVKKQTANETQAKILEKQTAQVETGRRAETVDEKTELQNRMSRGGTDGEAARLEYIRKYLV